MNESQPRTEGRISNLISAIKKLVYEDALIACFFLVLVVPIAWILLQALGAGNYTLVIICVGVESGLAIFMFIPLVITKKRKDTANQIDGFRNDAMLIEAKRRASVDENKQKRFNDVIDAKIGLLKAQQDFILSQSDRHERRLLAQLSEDLGKFIKEGPVLVKRDECMGNVTKILEELNSVHINYDEVLKNLEEIQSYVIHKSERTDTSTPKPEPDPTESAKIYIAGLETELKIRAEEKEKLEKIIEEGAKVIKNKNEDIAGLIENLEGGSKNYNELQADYDKVKALLEAEKAKESLTERVKKKVNLSIFKTDPRLGFQEETEFSDPSDREPSVHPLKDAMKVLDDMTDPTDETEPAESKEEESLDLASDQQNNEFKPYSIQGIPILEKQAKPIVWVCKCKRENEISRLRCTSCGAGKPIISITNCHSF